LQVHLKYYEFGMHNVQLEEWFKWDQYALYKHTNKFSTYTQIDYMYTITIQMLIKILNSICFWMMMAKIISIHGIVMGYNNWKLKNITHPTNLVKRKKWFFLIAQPNINLVMGHNKKAQSFAWTTFGFIPIFIFHSNLSTSTLILIYN
jgi:hypothetical protein